METSTRLLLKVGGCLLIGFVLSSPLVLFIVSTFMVFKDSFH
jgi:hypothetical protein